MGYPYQYIPNLFDDVPNPSMGPKPSDSTNLGKNIFEHVGIDPNIGGTGSHEKQHLIPQEVYKKSKFLQEIGFNVDHYDNGIFDKNKNNTSNAVRDIFKRNHVSQELTDRYISDKTHHGGGHKYYNEAVRREVKNIQKESKRFRDDLIKSGVSTDVANEQYIKYGQRKVGMLVEDLRTMNIDGIDLYKDHSSNSNKYKNTNEYYEEFKKRKQKAHEKNWHKKY